MAHISGHVSGTWDNHTEYTKNAVDTEHSAKVEAAKKGIVQCSKHPGTWTSKPKSGMMNKNQVEVRDCPKCQEEHELELKRKQLEMLPPPIANPIHAAPRAGQPVALGVMVANQGQGYVDRNKGYSSEWYNLCDDCPVCICTFCPCCIPLAIMDIAHRIHAPSHGIGGIITTIMATVCYPCGILCCASE